MPRYAATSAMSSGAIQPFSSCTKRRADITADCFWSAGYFFSSRFISSCTCSDNILDASKNSKFAQRPHKGTPIRYGQKQPVRSRQQGENKFLQRRILDICKPKNL